MGFISLYEEDLRIPIENLDKLEIKGNLEASKSVDELIFRISGCLKLDENRYLACDHDLLKKTKRRYVLIPHEQQPALLGIIIREHLIPPEMIHPEILISTGKSFGDGHDVKKFVKTDEVSFLILEDNTTLEGKSLNFVSSDYGKGYILNNGYILFHDGTRIEGKEIKLFREHTKPLTRIFYNKSRYICKIQNGSIKTDNLKIDVKDGEYYPPWDDNYYFTEGRKFNVKDGLIQLHKPE